MFPAYLIELTPDIAVERIELSIADIAAVADPIPDRIPFVQ